MLQSYCPTYNQVIDVADIISDSGVIIEPVTLQEMKDFMRLEGFEDNDASGELPFISDDDMIEELITSARELLEIHTGRSIVPHTSGHRPESLKAAVDGPRVPWASHPA